MKYTRMPVKRNNWRSSSTRRTWIEISGLMSRVVRRLGRPPHGGRGLKSWSHSSGRSFRLSSSTRRTWIEIIVPRPAGRGIRSSSTRRTWIEIYAGLASISGAGRRPPHGGRGLKWLPARPHCLSACGRPPHGGRGLKYFYTPNKRQWTRRPPHGGRGLKFMYNECNGTREKSSSIRRTWIEIQKGGHIHHAHGSSSTRRTWIEIGKLDGANPA